MASASGGYLLGNLVRDPEVKELANDKTVAEFSIAVTSYGGGKEHTSFFDCVAFGKAAAFIGEYLSKGSPVFLDCTPKQERWESDGKKRSRVKFLVNRVVSTGRRSSED